jgi:hypothetical protein
MFSLTQSVEYWWGTSCSVMTLFELLQDFTALSELPHDMDRMSSLGYLNIQRSRSLRMLPESLAFSQSLAIVEVSPSTVVVSDAIRVRCAENGGSPFYLGLKFH